MLTTGNRNTSAKGRRGTKAKAPSVDGPTGRTLRSAADTVALALMRALKASGTRRLFGVPGGGSSLDLIEAAHSQGMAFVLARHECAAVFMACATAEMDGSIGAALTTKGPGTANAANGLAQASLDRNPVVLLTDGFSPAAQRYVTHQWFDQRALMAPVAKGHSLLADGDVHADIDRLMALALSPRQGPVHIELTGAAARAPLARRAPARPARDRVTPASDLLASAGELLGQARLPVIVVGLESRSRDVTAAVRKAARALACPVLVTYKAKGVIADGAPLYGGIFTGGLAEQALMKQADLIVLVGMDPVELILQPWAYQAPVLEIGLARHPVHYVEPTVALHGDIAGSLAAITAGRTRSAWQAAQIAHLRAQMLAGLAYRGQGKGLSPQVVVEEAASAALALPVWPRVTVDAGAHMFSATAFWPCHAPNDLLISNGLATMGFALPAAIASALHQPGRCTVAFTGDGGLMMCLGELATAVQEQARIVVVVFNDASLSLIDIKQQQRELPVRGVRWDRPDFALVMRGLGGKGYKAAGVAAYRRALAAAFADEGPSLIDVTVDPTGYPSQLAALRG
jgi:acetolactate synthase-1/2/3 large subunit